MGQMLSGAIMVDTTDGEVYRRGETLNIMKISYSLKSPTDRTPKRTIATHGAPLTYLRITSGRHMLPHQSHGYTD